MILNSFLKNKKLIFSVFALISAFSIIFSPIGWRVFASPDAGEVKQEIHEQNRAIKTLEQEIKKYEQRLNEVADRKHSLKNAVETLDISRRKIKADIELAQKKIDEKTAEIQNIDSQISDKQKKIENTKGTLGKSVREMHEIESQTLVEAILSYDTLSEFWGRVNDLQRFQETLDSHLSKLKQLKASLQEKRAQKKEKQQELIALRRDLYERKRSLDIARQEKNSLLLQTKNKESNYQQIIAEKKRKKKQFEQELRRLEAKLQIIVDPEKIPDTQNGVLSWPLDNVYITQYFGNTPFATQNPQVYPGNGHNGVDFRASPGTPVRSALSGTVKNFGNTDNTCPGASYWRWVLVEHGNGLSTLYAHLSRVSVSKGQNISTGETIGYSGNSGYATGPHLHFGLYATQGVKVSKMESGACAGAVYTLPIADSDAYLNPMSYLPSY